MFIEDNSMCAFDEGTSVGSHSHGIFMSKTICRELLELWIAILLSHLERNHFYSSNHFKFVGKMEVTFSYILYNKSMYVHTVYMSNLWSSEFQIIMHWEYGTNLHGQVAS